MVRTSGSIVAIAAVALALLGCEEGRLTGVLAGGIEAADLVGTWTGTEEISGTEEPAGGIRTETEGDGHRFRVALRLRKDRGFTLHSFGYPVNRGTTRTVCAGVWDLDGRTLEFFPNTECRALPLSRYVIGRNLGDRMTLEARTGRQAGGGFTPGDIRVRIVVDRD